MNSNVTGGATSVHLVIVHHHSADTMDTHNLTESHPWFPPLQKTSMLKTL